jgi:hypothetical protein
VIFLRVLLLRPAFYLAVLRDLRNVIVNAAVGPTCRVTLERVDPAYRAMHEHTEHPTDGPCVLL